MVCRKPALAAAMGAVLAACGGSSAQPDGQVCDRGTAPGSQTVRDQLAAEELQGYTAIEGDLTIDGTSMRDLSAFGCLVSVGESLSIAGNSNLESLSGLDHLATVGDRLFISDNPTLSDLTGLGALHTVRGPVFLVHNANLISVDGSGIQNIGGTFQGGLTVRENGELSDLSALAGVGVDEVWIEANPKLASLRGLAHLDTLSVLRIDDNDSLIDLTELDGFLGAGDLVIINNDQLRSIAGPRHQEVGFLAIMNNPALEMLAGFEDIQSLGDARIIGNRSMTSLGSFGALQQVGADLRIQQNASLSDLSGIANLTMVGGSVLIDENGGLMSISGFESLAAMQSLHIRRNESLPDCEVNQFVADLASRGYQGPVDASENDPAGSCP